MSLEEIRKRDAEAGSTWFKEPPLGACGRAFIDRRWLLAHIVDLEKELAEARKGEAYSDRVAIHWQTEAHMLRVYGNNDCTAMADEELERQRGVGPLSNAEEDSLRERFDLSSKPPA